MDNTKASTGEEDGVQKQKRIDGRREAEQAREDGAGGEACRAGRQAELARERSRRTGQ
jgi:hypothetical protein